MCILNSNLYKFKSRLTVFLIFRLRQKCAICREVKLNQSNQKSKVILSKLCQHGNLNTQRHSGGQSPSSSTRPLHLIHIHITSHWRNSVRRFVSTADRRRTWRAGRPATSDAIWRQRIKAKSHTS